ncbi:hypothetical protein MOD14_11310 [Bacillus haynesii]|uniref:hypothetical protein n=1 Tax=Bacillus haynesii TaxID=1925021 RepID=UPI00227E4D55|nr:hypothetical protein [Bacillus haynesii]MCY8354756.1 hypothetical protein [Bacillus haynesii]MCY8554718.1 hypothetical protein [Bacillus haynesii]MCY8613293.1 hypothetical protein [Bacillus haynesii]
MQRLLLINFVDERLLVAINLKIHLQEYEDVQNRLRHFIYQIQKASGQSDVKYLAVLDLPSKKSASNINLNLITDIEIGKLTMALDGDLSDEQEDEYLKKILKASIY